MSSSPTTLGKATMMRDEQRLLAVLRRVRRRWFLVEWLQVAAWTALAGAAALALAGLAAWLVQPADEGLLVVFGAAGLVTAAVATAVALPLRRRPTDLQVARYVEERVPELEDRLATAAGADDAARRLALFAPMLRDAAEWAEGVDLDRVVAIDLLKRRWLQAAAATTVLVVAVTFTWAPLGQASRVARALIFPPSVDVVVTPGDVAVIAGHPLAVDARFVGLTPGLSPGEVSLFVEDARGEAQERLSMAPGEDGRFRAEIPRVDRDLVYRVRGARHGSRDFTVTVRVPPAVEQIDVHYEYPAFSGLPPRTDEDGGDIYAPAGTRVRLHVTADRPVAAGALALAGGERLEATRLGPRDMEVRFVVERDGAYRVALVDEIGLAGREGTEYFIRTLDDRPPDVRILRPAGDQKVTRLEEVAVEARADDDYGISRFELVYAASSGEQRVVPFERGAGGTSASGRHVLHVEDLDVQPGDFVTYYARAWDVGRGKRPTEARSDIFFLEVRPFNEEFEAVTSQAMMSGAAGAFDDLAAQQKDIIIATWKLDRRAGAGKSAEDIRAVARAQGEVREKAARIAGRMLAGLQMAPQAGRRGRRGNPDEATGESQSPAPPNPMLQAVEAMTRAEAALDALETAQAVPHEMEALNQLLRAEADVRRRQVGRQQQSAQGGGGSGNQDLSALFDRELQRQQETNYEQPASSAEQRAETASDDTLARLRELARRQDDLSRRQQELARRRGELPEEEVKRRLERLTREQQELRREAQQLARDMGERGNQSGQRQRGQAASGGEGGDDVQNAAEAMGQSAGDLQRERASEASARASEAAERLRSAERRLQGARPDERRRAAGDMQLEAQQLAEAQRRVGRDAAARAGGDTDTGADADAWRRLAGEQERLAERAARLGQDARDVAAGADGREADALRQAARELQRGQVDERMREAASSLRRAAESGAERDEGAASAVAASSRQVAEALERAARQLGSAAGRDPETGRVAEDLARARDVRDRLSELGRDIDRLARQQEGRGEPAPGATGAAAGEAAQPGERGTGQGEGRGESQSGEASRSAGEGSQGGGGIGAGSGGDVGRLQADFVRELQHTEGLIERLRREDPALAESLSSLEGWTPSRSAPGTEAFKQDFARWDALRRGVSLALERLEAELATQLGAAESRDRVETGADMRTPARYRRQVADYYRSLADETRPAHRPPDRP